MRDIIMNKPNFDKEKLLRTNDIKYLLKIIKNTSKI